MDAVKNIKNITLRPKESWPAIKNEITSTAELYTFAIILAAIPAICKLIGISLIGMSVTTEINVGPFTMNFFWNVVFSYALSLVGIKIISFIVDFLAPRFDSKRNLNNATKLVIYSWTPYWVAGVLYLIPQLALIVLFFSFYGIYIFYHGLPVLMETPKERTPGYVIAVIALSVFSFLFMGAMAGIIFALSGAKTA
jgi:hypothetical protein